MKRNRMEDNDEIDIIEALEKNATDDLAGKDLHRKEVTDQERETGEREAALKEHNYQRAYDRVKKRKKTVQVEVESFDDDDYQLIED